MKTIISHSQIFFNRCLFSTNHKYIGRDISSTMFLSPGRSISFLHGTTYSNCFRSMYTVNSSSRKVIANSFFQGLKHLTKPTVLDNITPQDPFPLVDSIVNYAVDDQIGTPQHKGAFIFNMIRQKFPLNLYQKSLDKKLPNSQIEWPKEGIADTRLVSEIPVAIAIAQDLPYINKLFMTNDCPPSNPTHPNFMERKQKNTDIETDLKSPLGEKQTYMDVKSGADMVQHTTRGHAGIITLFENKIVPFSINKQCSSAYIFDTYNNTRVQRIRDVIGIDKCSIDFSDTLNKINGMYKGVSTYSTYSNNASHVSLSNGPSLNSIELHNQAQRLLWSDIQCHPGFKRSVGVIFVRTINRLPTDAEYQAYLNRINELLPDGHYDMSKFGDKKFLLRISIKAYMETVDPYVYKKLEYLVNNNIKFDDMIIQLLHDISQGKFS